MKNIQACEWVIGHKICTLNSIQTNEISNFRNNIEFAFGTNRLKRLVVQRMKTDEDFRRIRAEP